MTSSFEKTNDIIKCKLILEDNTEFIIPMREDGYIFATGLCKASGKIVGNWLRLKETKELVRKYENPAFLLLIGEFEAESITREDLKRVFGQSIISVIFMDEINIDELESIKQKIKYHEQEKQKLLDQLENIENGMIKKQ